MTLATVSCVSAASTVYVNSTGGSDTNLGTADSPFLTIDKGISSVDENGTVNIAQGIYTGTGNTNLTVTRSMTITGESQDNTIINGEGTSWIFKIRPEATVAFFNLTFANATAGIGGAIYSTGTLSITDCTFTGNNATSTVISGGGAIYNGGTIDNLLRCTFRENTANNGDGGAIDNHGTINNITDCVFANNTVKSDDPEVQETYQGGAIYNTDTIGKITGCTFTGNVAEFTSDCVWFYGGGIFNDGTISDISTCTFQGNSAYYGGALNNQGTINNVTDCVFTQNIAGYGGGAISNAYDAVLGNLRDCTFAENTAQDGPGGAIDNYALATIDNMEGCTFTGNTAYNGDGGAIQNKGTMNTLTHCIFTGNTAENGGAISNCITMGNLTNCTFTNNNAIGELVGYGGAIANMGGTINGVMDSIFTANTAGDGGAIHNDEEGVLSKVTGCTFTLNTADYGGAICNFGEDMIVSFNRLVNNTASNGAAIYSAFIQVPGSNFVNATLNWWGTNNPDFVRLVGTESSIVDVSTWLYMTITADSPIYSSATSNVTVSFNNAYNGTILTPIDPVNGHIPDGTPVNFQSDRGTLNPANLLTANGVVNTTFTPTATGSTSVNATTDNQTVSFNLSVNPACYLYLDGTSDPVNPVAGQPFTLKYKLGNKGPNTAQNVVIYIPLPEGLNYVGAQVDTGSVSYNANNRTLTWILDSVPMGDPYLNLTVISTAGGSFTIRPVISSGTFNANLDPTGIFSFNVQGNGSKGTVVNAASTTKTVPMESTGTPVNYLVLAVLMVVSGLIAPKIKK